MQNGNETGGWGDIFVRQYFPALILVCLGVWLHAADSLLVATMLPRVVADIGGHALVGWTVSLYEIGTILTGAASGLVATRYGIRLSMGVAAVVFAIGCIVSAFAPTMWIVLVGRLLQGLGGGGLMAISFVATNVLFPKYLVPRVIAAASLIWGTSAFLGPLIGGLFVEYSTWRNGFGFFAVQALVLLLWIAFGLKSIVQPSRHDRGASILSPRLLLLALGVVLIAYSGVQFSAIRTLILLVIATVAIILFLRLDSRDQHNRLLPRQPLSLLTPVGSALTMVLCISIATIAITAYGPILIVMLHSASELVAGYIVACSSIGWSIAAFLASGSPQRLDRTFIATGMAVVTVSIVGFLYSVPNGPIWLIAVFAVLEGAGFGLCWGFILRQTTSIASANEQERVAGALPTIQRLGYAIGAAYVGIVANFFGFAESTDYDNTVRVATLIFSFCLPFAVIALIATGRFVLLSSEKH